MTEEEAKISFADFLISHKDNQIKGQAFDDNGGMCAYEAYDRWIEENVYANEDTLYQKLTYPIYNGRQVSLIKLNENNFVFGARELDIPPLGFSFPEIADIIKNQVSVIQ